MNTKAIGAASEVICRAMAKDLPPATIAVALDAHGLLAGPEAAVLTRELRAEADELRTKLEIAERRNAELADRARLHGEMADQALQQWDDARKMADRLACAVAPLEVIGEHSSANCPWENALEMITPAAEVDRLRKENADLEASLGLNEAA